MMLCSDFSSSIQSWLRDYVRIQSLATILIYIQICCSLIGSLGAFYNGVVLINLGIGLFAVVAIESSSQSLARAYALLLFSAILIDICWFILFTLAIWNMSSEIYGKLVVFSVKLMLFMQIIGFSARLSSSFLWIQMYRLGMSHVQSINSQDADLDLTNSFINPATPAVVRQPSGSDDGLLGGSIYDPAYYSSLFEYGQEDGYSFRSQNHSFGEGGSISAAASACQFKASTSRSLKTIHDENAISKFWSV